MRAVRGRGTVLLTGRAAVWRTLTPEAGKIVRDNPSVRVAVLRQGGLREAPRPDTAAAHHRAGMVQERPALLKIKTVGVSVWR